MDFLFASNNAFGGPFSLELNGQQIASNITVSSTGGWDNWATKSRNDIPLIEGFIFLAFDVNLKVYI